MNNATTVATATDATTRFDVAVVGGGLIGSAAARHLAEAGRTIAVIAAPEPTDWASSNGPFASHYDASRITRVIASDPVWAELAKRSIDRYADIEARSGIRFHDPRGLAWLGLDIAEAVQFSNERGGDARMVDLDWLFATTGIRAPAIDGLQAALEGAPAGVVNPRALVQAQLLLAHRAGARVIRSGADHIRRAGSDIVVSGPFGEIRANRVLLATGAYGAHLVGVRLDIRPLLRTTLRIELGAAVEMPSLILDPVPHPDINDLYWNPPVRYPDGRVRFKVGCEILNAKQADSGTEVSDWFATAGDPVEAAALLETSRAMLPTRRFETWDTVPCVITRTPTGYPYIGFLDDRIAVALAGNGSSAKSSDELGRLAASLFGPQGWHDVVLDAARFAPLTV